MKFQSILHGAVGVITCVILHLPAEQLEITGERLDCSRMATVETSDFVCKPPLGITAVCNENKQKISSHIENLANLKSLAKPVRGSHYIPRPGLNFTAFTNINSPVSRWTSFVDVMGAAGPKQYIVCTNTGVISFNKETGKRDGVLETTLTSLASNVFPYPFAVITDPQIRFDTFSDRWYITFFTEEFGPTASNHLFLMISDGPVIKKKTHWTQYVFLVNQIPPPSGFPEFLDFENLGIDKHALYIGYRSDNNATGGTVNDAALVIQKASLFNGGPVVLHSFRNLLTLFGVDMPRGVDNFDLNPTFGYFIGSVVAGPNLMNVGIFRVNNPGSTNPTLSPIQIVPGTTIISPGIPSNALNVPLVPHKGNLLGPNGLLDLEAGAFFNPHIRNNHLFGAIGTLVNSAGISDPLTADRGACFFYEFNLNHTTPTAVQVGKLFDSTTKHAPIWYFMPTCMTNKKGDLIMGFSIAGEDQFVNAGVVGRFAKDPLGTFSKVFRVTHNNQFAFNAGDRWGDYCHSSPDPDGKRIWTFLEFVSEHNTYAGQLTEWLPAKR